MRLLRDGVLAFTDYKDSKWIDSYTKALEVYRIKELIETEKKAPAVSQTNLQSDDDKPVKVKFGMKMR